MFKVLSFVIICFLVQSCCDKPPEKVTELNININSKDSSVFNNITKIYAKGGNSARFERKNDSTQFARNYFKSIQLPINYAVDSTIYIFEYKKKINDTLIIHYNREIGKSEDGCNFNVILTKNNKPHYLSIKNYLAEVRFGTFLQRIGTFGNQQDNACTINIYPKGSNLQFFP